MTLGRSVPNTRSRVCRAGRCLSPPGAQVHSPKGLAYRATARIGSGDTDVRLDWRLAGPIIARALGVDVKRATAPGEAGVLEKAAPVPASSPGLVGGGPRRYHVNWPAGDRDRYLDRRHFEDNVEPEPIAADGVRLPAGDPNVGPILAGAPPGPLTGRYVKVKTL